MLCQYLVRDNDHDMDDVEYIAGLVELYNEIDAFRDGSVSYDAFQSYITRMGDHDADHVNIDAVPRYIVSETDSDLASSRPHDVNVAIAIHDDNRVALCDGRGYCEVINDDGTIAGKFGNHNDVISDLVYLAEKQLYITFSVDGGVKHWNKDWSMVYSNKLKSPVLSAAYNSAQKLVYGGDASGNICAWQLDSWVSPLMSHRCHDDMITCICMVGDTEIATGCADGTVALWDISQVYSGVVCCRGRYGNYIHPGGVRSLSCSLSFESLVVTCGDRHAYVWSIRSPQSTRPVRLLSEHASPLIAAIASPNGPQVVTADVLGTIKIWDWRYGCIQSMPRREHSDPGASLVVLYDPPKLVSAGRTIEILQSELIGDPKLTDNQPISGVMFIDALKCYITASGCDIRVWSAVTGLMSHVYRRVVSSRISCMTCDPDGSHIYLGDVSGELTVISASTGFRVLNVKAHDSEMVCMLYYEPKRCIVSLDISGVVHARSDSRSFSLIHTLCNAQRNECLCISSSRYSLCVLTVDGTSVYNRLSGAVPSPDVVLTKATGSSSVLFEPHNVIAIANAQNIVLWSTKYPSPRPLLSMINYCSGTVKSTVTCLAYSSSYKLLYSGDEEGEIKCWSVSRVIDMAQYEVCLCHYHVIVSHPHALLET